MTTQHADSARAPTRIPAATHRRHRARAHSQPHAGRVESGPPDHATLTAPERQRRMSKLTANEQNQLLALWAKRSQGLSTAEMRELSILVKRVLVNTKLPSEYSNAKARAELIHAFISERVLLNQTTSTAKQPYNVHALRTFLKNFAITQWRKATGKKTVSFDDASKYEEPSADDDESAVDDTVGHLELSEAQILVEAGINIEKAFESAGQFAASLEPYERAYLAFNTCADRRKPIEEIGALYQLGSSYHYRAKKLGITGGKSGFFEGYEHTRIGRWMVSLGVKISREWHSEMMILINILCQQVPEPQRKERA